MKPLLPLVLAQLACLSVCAQQFVESHAEVNLFETTGDLDLARGVSCADLDGDGWEELIFPSDFGDAPHIYQWNGAQFELLEEPDGFVFESAENNAVVAADFDNDGDKDLFLVNRNSPNKLYRNDGDLAFTDISYSAGILFEFFDSFATTVNDFDGDGWLDIYVCNRAGIDNPQANRFYKNMQDGTFVELAEELGIADQSGASMAAGTPDLNNDGKPDLVVANDRFTGNKMWLNNGAGGFDLLSGQDYALESNYMSVSHHDLNGDGLEDVYMANTAVGNALLASDLAGPMSNQCEQYNLAVHETCWGTHFFDADNDGDRDLYVATYSPNPAVDHFYVAEDGSFELDNGMLDSPGPSQGMGVISLDHDHDGDLDMLVANGAGLPAFFYENQGTFHPYIQLTLEGTESNKDGIGTWVSAWQNGLAQRYYTRCGSDFASQSSAVVHFGLGSEPLDSLTLDWPSSIHQVLVDPIVNEMHHIVEEVESDPEEEWPLEDFAFSIQEYFSQEQNSQKGWQLFDFQGKLVSEGAGMPAVHWLASRGRFYLLRVEGEAESKLIYTEL